MIKKVFIFLFIFIFLSSCDSKKHKKKDILSIVCTTGMIADTVKNISGPYAQVKALMGPGVDPHLYKARARDMVALQDADVIFYNGLHLESKMADVLEKIKKIAPKKVHSLGNTLPESSLLREDKDIYDPHVWMAPLLWKKTLNGIYKKLSFHLPDKKSFFAQQSRQYSLRLKKIHSKIQKIMADIPSKQRVLITAHDAFGYLGREYKIKVMGIQGLSTASEAGIQDIQRISDYIVKNKIPSIFAEHSVSSKSIQALKEAVKAKGFQVKIAPILYADSLGSKESKASTYLSMILYNASIIAKYLKINPGN